MQIMKLALSCMIAVVMSTGSASAAIIGVAGGTAAPSSTLGSFTMTPFADDTDPLFANVTSLPSPLGGNITFDNAIDHRTIGNGWATWSHGYLGDVYYSNGVASLTITLPALTGAFYFYVEPDPFSVHSFSAVANGGTPLNQLADGNSGAVYFGFYTTDLTPISSITITDNDNVGFAIGEFGIAQLTSSPVPEPASLALCGMGGLALAFRGFRRRQSQLKSN